MKISNESKVGIFAAIAITFLILGYNYLKGKDLFSSTKTFYAVFDKVDGLVASNAVVINGYRIGQVNEVQILPENNLKLLVTIEVKSEIPVPKNSTMKIFSSDLFNSKAVELVFNTQETTLAHNNDTLIAYLEPGLMDNLSNITKPLREKVESILISLDSTLGGSAGAGLQKSMAQLPLTFDKLNNTIDDVNMLVDTRLKSIAIHAESIVKNLDNNQAMINNIIGNMSALSDSLPVSELKQTVANANKAIADLHTTLENINKGQGTVGQLLTNEQLYTELKNSASSLDSLLKDLKENPKRYVSISVFGRKDKKK